MLKISIAEASDYVSRFINQSPLTSIAQNNAIGGTFGLPALSSASGEGLMFWFGYKETSPGSHLFEVAFQGDRDPGSGVSDRLSVGNTPLYSPNDRFTYPLTGTSSNDVKAWLETHDTANIPRSNSISKVHVEEAVADFLASFPKDANCYPYNDRAHLFFSAQDGVGDFYDLVSQANAAGLRYYFGYDESTDPDPINRIRLILFAVDSTGKNIVSTSNAVILQRGKP
jgi:hypothetical protein